MPPDALRTSRSRVPNVLDGFHHRRHRTGIGQIGADDQHLDAEFPQLGSELLGPRCLVAEVDDDVRAASAR
jgi:hypothetical protein